MSISGSNSYLARKHQDLCKVLYLDRSVSNDIWKHFLQHYDEFILEGDPVHWLGCASYLRYSCGHLATLGKQNTLNLTKLLRSTNLSLIEFFQKCKKWAEVCGLSDDNMAKLKSLQRGFAVSMVIFKKFRSIFYDVFLDPLTPESITKGPKSKRAKLQPTNNKKLFEFTWCLYISVKSSFPEFKDDLVHSQHLLLAACDYIFANIFVGGRNDIINPAFTENKNSVTSGRYSSSVDVPCIIDVLCQRHTGVPIEAKQVKEYFWKKYIKQLFDKKHLKGNSDTLLEITEPSFIDINFKFIDKLYDEFILTAGDFDERLFLANSFFTELAGSGLQEKIDVMSSQILESERKISLIGSRVVSTPLSAKRFLKDSETIPRITLSPSFNTVATLHSMLYGKSAEPTDFLLQVIKKAGDLNPPVETRVSDMAQIVYAHLTESSTDIEGWSDDLALSRVDISKKLYYRLLEKLLIKEMENPNFNCKILLKQDIFHKTLFACAVELVIFTYRSPWVFPWILDTLHISAYHFSRIIEVVVRADELLSRDMIKHLNWVEEVVLERLAWKSDSPLWKAIIESSQNIPSCEDVSVHHIAVKSELASQDSGIDVNSQTNVITGQTDKLSELSGQQSALIESPGIPLSEKFQSPILQSVKIPATILNDSPSINDDKIVKRNSEYLGKEKPKRTGAIALFFRKFYYLSSVRLQDMCDQLNLSENNLRQKIWTSFEQTIINHINLMIDRHLDQILMCSIYVICKIVGPEQKFTNMMKCYRNQPQAQSRVYRNVLLGPEKTLQDLTKGNGLKRTMPETGDLIQFYNRVFVDKVEDLVRKFKMSTQDGSSINLSPIPCNITSNQPSPRRRVSDARNFFIRCLNQKSPSTKISSTQFSFYFNQSPVKNLKTINNILSQDTRKRPLANDDSENIERDFNTSSAFNRKVKDLFNDRMAAKSIMSE